MESGDSGLSVAVFAAVSGTIFKSVCSSRLTEDVIHSLNRNQPVNTAGLVYRALISNCAHF